MSNEVIEHSVQVKKKKKAGKKNPKPASPSLPQPLESVITICFLDDYKLIQKFN